MTEIPQTRPRKLNPGDKLAAVTLSWGGPGEIPERYRIGKQQLEETFDVTVAEMPHTCASPDFVSRNPAKRADDLIKALHDPSISGIVSTIGGDDSIRLIPYLDYKAIAENPKVFIGYSDTTVSHLAWLKAGVRSFYGPSIMAGFAENCGMHDYLVESVRRMLFQTGSPGAIMANEDGWTAEQIDWLIPGNNSIPRALSPCTGWRFLQGTDKSRGHLLGGCLEVLEWVRGTELWPTLGQWHGAILFLETSELAPPPHIVQSAMRSYAAEGVLEVLSGILFGRPGGQIEPTLFSEYDDAILQVVRDEQGLDHLPIVTNMDFGHTDPMMTLPYGALTEIDSVSREIRLLESSVVD